MKTKSETRLVIEVIVFTALWIAAATALYFLCKI
jgi:hypothetical protein